MDPMIIGGGVTAVANLISTAVARLGADARQRRRDPPRLQALARIADAMLAAGLAALPPANREVETQTEALLRRFIAQPDVVDELARLVAADEPPNMAALGDAIVRAGAPYWRTHPDFPRAVRAMARAFVTEASREPALQDELKLDRLGQLIAGVRSIDATVQRLVEPAAEAPAPQLGPDDVSLGRLPPVGPHFFGRADELAALDASWAADEVRIHTVIGVGGEGKSTLVQRWLDRIGADGWRGATRVYGWSFYSQGAREEQQTSADLFVNQLLEWLGDPDPHAGDGYARARRLAKRLRKQKTLLVLDGLEPLQYGPGANAGRIRDAGLSTLLRDLRSENPGLVVISSRQPLVELGRDGPVVERRLPALDPTDGARLLAAHGVGGADEELETASAELKGHALALHLLGGYLAMYEEADIRRRDRIDSLLDAEDGGGHARRVMAAYDLRLGEPERQILRLLGLFDRVADGPALDALLATPPTTGLNDALGPRDGKVWKRALKHITDLGLASRSGDGLDGHPLVREAFGELLHSEAESAWIAGHRRLFGHFQQGKRQPDTLIEMEPLYRAVRHGCLAGRHERALRVFQQRIRRGDKHYSTVKLGAYAADLGALAYLFVAPWRGPHFSLSDHNQSWVLNSAGASLQGLGRLTEARGPLGASVQRDTERQDWHRAFSSTSRLGGLLLALGRLERSLAGEAGAEARSRDAVHYAERSGQPDAVVSALVRLADVLHQRGRVEAARMLFEHAERIHSRHQRRSPRLYAGMGHVYCTLLITQDPGDVRRRAFYSLQISSRNGWLKAMALDQLLLGQALHSIAGGAPSSTLAEARARLGIAVASLRRANSQPHVPLGLLARAALHRDAGDWPAARADLTEAHEIAERGGMRLHLADVHLETARLALAQGDPSAARPAYDAAIAMIQATRYHRRDPEVVALAEALGLSPPPWVGQSDIMVDLPIAQDDPPAPEPKPSKTRKRKRKRKR